jgi:hypothetical protein
MFTILPPTHAIGTKDGTVSDVILACACNVLRLPSGRWKWVKSAWCPENHGTRKGKAVAEEVATP